MLERAITQCNDSSLRVALKSIHSDLLNRKGCLVPLNVAPRKCAKKDIYVIGGSKRELHSVWDRGLEMNYVSVEKFNTFSREWNKVPDMTVNRLVPGVAALNGHIYVVGGEEGSSILSSCERFEPQTNQWTQVASMVVSRCEFGLCALDGYLYAMGGWVDTDISGSIERYDPKIDEWRLVGSLPEPRFSMGLVSYEGKCICESVPSTQNRPHLHGGRLLPQPAESPGPHELQPFLRGVEEAPVDVGGEVSDGRRRFGRLFVRGGGHQSSAGAEFGGEILV